MSTLKAQNRKPGRDDRDFVEIPMRGTARELASIQGEGSSPEPMETTIESRGWILWTFVIRGDVNEADERWQQPGCEVDGADRIWRTAICTTAHR